MTEEESQACPGRMADSDQPIAVSLDETSEPQFNEPAVPWRLPSEITLLIFELLPRPLQSDQVEHSNYQTRLSELCLICKATLPPARALLLRCITFDFLKKDSHISRKNLLAGLGRMGSRESGIAYAADSFWYINYPASSARRASRMSVLQSILDITSLSEVLISLEFGGKLSMYEIISIFESCGTSVHGLKSITLRNFTVDSELFRFAFIYLVALPSLSKLELDIYAANHNALPRTVRIQTGPLSLAEEAQTRSSQLKTLNLRIRRLQFFSLGNFLLQEGMLPESITTLRILDQDGVLCGSVEAFRSFIGKLSSLKDFRGIWKSSPL